MTLMDRINPTFTCDDCNGRVIPRSERIHHEDHHVNRCRCTEPLHRIIAPWLRNGTFRRTGEQS